MSLLLDHNLSPRLVTALAERFAGVQHVRDVSLQNGSDTQIWEYAKSHHLAIVSKDSDFRQMSFVRGHPPKVIWVRTGNSSTETLLALFVHKHREIETFLTDSAASFLVLE